MANIMDLFSQAEVVEINFDIEKAKGIFERIKQAQEAVGGRPKLKAKVGSGGVKVFQFTNGSKDVVMEKFQGIIIAHHKNNALFPAVTDDEIEAMNKPPVCASTDGITGVVLETGECRNCEDCPHNIFGTDGKGKECKNMHRLYILMEGCPIPVTLSLPPTSLELWRNYALMDVAAAGLDMAEVVTEFSLTNEVNEAGQKYSIVNFKIVGKVSDEVKAICADMGGAIEQSPRLAIAADEYNREPAPVLQQADEEDEKLPDWDAENAEVKGEPSEVETAPEGESENGAEPEEVDIDSL